MRARSSTAERDPYKIVVPGSSPGGPAETASFRSSKIVVRLSLLA